MDPEKNKEMQRAFNYYRNNLTGEPPAGTGDDLYNDRVDNIHVDEQHLTNIGNDEAGNPIMANPVNMPSDPEPVKQVWHSHRKCHHYRPVYSRWQMRQNICMILVRHRTKNAKR